MRLGWSSGLFEDPLVAGGGPLDESLGEPEGNLVLGGLLGVGAVDEIAADDLAKVATDGARGGVGRLGGAEDLAALCRRVESLPDHRDDGTGGHVVDQPGKEGLAVEIFVVLLKMGATGRGQLHRDELEALLFESEN